MQTRWGQMADGKMQTMKCGQENADDKMQREKCG